MGLEVPKKSFGEGGNSCPAGIPLVLGAGEWSGLCPRGAGAAPEEGNENGKELESPEGTGKGLRREFLALTAGTGWNQEEFIFLRLPRKF